MSVAAIGLLKDVGNAKRMDIKINDLSKQSQLSSVFVDEGFLSNVH